MTVILVVGARPNFMKAAPVYKAFKNNYPDVNVKICHTGQHYDSKMSDVFFRDLGMPEPEFYLGVGSGSHAVQTANIMIEFEKVCIAEQPNVVLVAGDVNSTIACGLVASKLHIKLGHIESGLRSFDRKMPEEINRILTDCISDYLFVTEHSGLENLKNEGIPQEKVFFTGNCMIDSLIDFLPKTEVTNIKQRLGIEGKYLLLTFHRPSNVDDKDFYDGLKELVNKYSGDFKLVFPIHPRTRKNLESFGVKIADYHNLILTEPLGYIDFLSLIKDSFCVITDSGGIQEETTYLGVPCITVRESTERPVTVEVGTNYLAGVNFNSVFSIFEEIIKGNTKKGKIPELWDGKAGARVAKYLVENYTS